MLLRRITKHVNNQNWFAVGIDFCIVVIGVFIGIQVANWNDTRRNLSLTQAYYGQLLQDLEHEETTMEGLIEYYQQAKAHGYSALDAFEATPSQTSPEILIDAYQTTQIWFYAPQRATYNELLEAGIVNYIRDPELRAQLANYYVSLESAQTTLEEQTPFRNLLRKYMPYDLQKEIRASCGDVFGYNDDGSLIVGLRDSCDLDVNPTLIEQAFEDLDEYDDLNFDLRRHLSNLDVKLASMESFLGGTRKMQAALAEVAQ